MTPLEKLLLELCRTTTWEGVRGKQEAILVIKNYARRIEEMLGK